MFSKTTSFQVTNVQRRIWWNMKIEKATSFSPKIILRVSPFLFEWSWYSYFFRDSNKQASIYRAPRSVEKYEVPRCCLCFKADFDVDVAWRWIQFRNNCSCDFSRVRCVWNFVFSFYTHKNQRERTYQSFRRLNFSKEVAEIQDSSFNEKWNVFTDD